MATTVKTTLALISTPKPEDFHDISIELQRTYTFPNGAQVTIEKPVKLHISARGGHRIVDAANHGHYVPCGWVHIEWIVAEGVNPMVL